LYKIKLCNSDLEKENFLKRANKNNHKIIGMTEFKGKLNFLYEVEEKKRTRKIRQQEEENKDIEKEEDK
jgi:hypothetical protein